jgi:hypothetical protein
MRGKCRLLDISRRNRNLPISAIAVEHRKTLRISKGVNALIHTRYWIRVPCGHGIRFTVIDSEPQGPIRFGHQDNRTCPLRNRRFYYACFQHSLHFCGFRFLRTEISPVWLRVHWLGPRDKVDSVSCGIDPTRPTVPHLAMFFQQLENCFPLLRQNWAKSSSSFRN